MFQAEVNDNYIPCYVKIFLQKNWWGWTWNACISGLIFDNTN